MKMMDQGWMDKFEPREYKREGAEEDLTKDNNFGYSPQGVKDLDEVGSMVGGGDADLLSILRPYYSMVEMSANGNKRGMGSYMHVLPDSKEGDTPIYSLGASFYGGIEPAGAKIGYMNRPFGK
ncbi:hypothetical protein WR25_10690 [Diploscapter pachys]|uniref:Uncharacterized protein n=1 Tax=Diploscapter pachys TaxID=2018661 RepID=A0A2A2LJE9_9BILA|nr:hypothetical protein WR25_19424 [Diploscapter pachys]PAV86289.1 hypothetical protein WR25_10690 [Diploscapter pachys]